VEDKIKQLIEDYIKILEFYKSVGDVKKVMVYEWVIEDLEKLLEVQ